MNNPVIVLYLEDSPRDVELVRDRLQEAPMACVLHVASDRTTYEAALAGTRFDLILSDYRLPGYDGMAALARARAQQPEVPFILISGTLGEEQAVDCVLRGATDYVLKQRLDRLVPAMVRALQEAENRQRRREAEAALRESEAKFRSFVEYASDIIYTLDADGRFTYISPNWTALLGHDSRDVLGRSFAEFVHPEDVPACRAFLERVLTTREKGGVIEYRVHHHNGTWRWYASTGSLLQASHGALLSFVGIGRDITARKQAEAALRASEQQLRAYLDNAGDAIYVVEQATGRILNCNARASHELGYSREEILQRSTMDIEVRRSAGEVTAIHQQLQPGEALTVDGEHRRKDGTVFPVEIRLSSLAPAQPELMIAIVRDITERQQAEEALHTSELRYRGLFESAKDGILILDAETGMVVDVNPFLIKLLGYSHEAFLSKKLWELGVLKDIVANRKNFKALQEKEYVRYEDMALETSDGRRIEVEFISNSYLVKQRRVMQCIIRDITARKRAEEALRQSEAEFRAMFEVASIGMAQADPHTGQWLRVNQKLCEITGYSAAELLRLRVPELTHPADRQQDWEAFQRVVRGEAPDYRLEKRYLRKDGTVAWVNVNMTILRDRTGRPVRTMATIEDITDRRLAAEAQARLAMAVEQAAETIVITDPKGTILYANPAFEKISGYTRAEACGQNPRVLQSGKHDVEFYRKLWAKLTAGQVWHGHFINKRKDGSLYEEDATISPVLDAAGQLINYVAVKRDITREVTLEEQNRQAAKMEAVGRLAGGVAHDFNNQLQVVLGCTEINLKTLPPDHPLVPDLQEIQQAASRSADLTRQLLAFSRQQAITPVVLDLNVAISGSLKMLSRLIGENIRLRFMPQPELWSVFIDPGQLAQLLANLTVNARDAIAATGTIVIEAANRTLRDADCADKPDFVPPGEYVELSVRDDGAGMSPEVQTRIFEPFFTTKEIGKGTGLGLATVYGIVKQNQGAITVHSVLGQGATFTILLPRSSCAARAAVDEKETELPTGTETVLVVEDQAAVLTLVERALAKQGYQVLTAVTPRLALQVCTARPEPIDLLLTDVIMPDMGGKELAERIRQLRPGIRILFMSGYPADIMEQHGQLQVGLQVLQKPFTSAALAQRIRAALDAPPRPAAT